MFRVCIAQSLRRHARPGAGLTLLVTAVLLTACGGGGGRSGAPSSPAQGSGAEPERSTFVDSSFVGLPKPAGAQSFGAATFEGGTWVQSYEVDGLDPLQTVAFYENRLDTDWVESPPLRRLGQCLAHGDTPETQCTYRGLWVSGDERLEVVAGPAGPGGTDGHASTELSLLLEGAQ